ncbi:hypothetical protein V5799_007048 [Amblyomma americanum]|uniref:PH domain-containing protein n=1 Tax=Amblyomma americanum TaxID=6943 RepID=A0AAQ4DUN8_AMBAM
MGLRFRRLRRMSSGEDAITTPPASSCNTQPQGGAAPNNASSEEDEANDCVAELSRPVRPLPIKDGYLHVLSGDHLWFRSARVAMWRTTSLHCFISILQRGYIEGFPSRKRCKRHLRLYVALHAEKLDAYYELSDKVPVISVSLAGCEVVTPDKVTGSAPGEVCFPIQLVKKRHEMTFLKAKQCAPVKPFVFIKKRILSRPEYSSSIQLTCALLCAPQDSAPVCFAADTVQEQQSWGDELRRRTQACSLSIQGLNLEGCSSLPAAAGVQSKVQPDENVLAQTLELLDELLKKKSDGKKLKKGDEAMGMSQDVEEVEQASIMAHQEALRKATHLRQRKISTELKVETLQKQLRKPSKKSQPRAIPELPEGRELVEEQLQELTQKLRLLEGNLGQTERQAQKVRREWDKKMEEVYQHLFENRFLTPEDALRENWERGGGDSSTPRITVSRDEGRSGGSLRVRAAKLIPSSRGKKKEDANGSVIKKSASNTSLNNGSGKAGDESDDTTKSSDSKEMEDTRTASKSRRSPLRIIGDFLESRKGRFGSTHRKVKPGDSFRSRSEHKRLKAHHSSTRSAAAVAAVVAVAEAAGDAASLMSADGPHMELPYLQLLEQESRLPSPAVEYPPSSQAEGNPAWRAGSSPPEELASPGAEPGGAKDGEHTAALAAVVAARNEELPLLHTDSGSCCSEDDARSLDSGSKLFSEDPDGNVRCHIDPEILAEIEAFEKMAQSYLKRHGHDFPF